MLVNVQDFIPILVFATYAFIFHVKIGQSRDKILCIKTHGSESQGQEEAACTRVSGLCDHYSELFTQMAALKV